jgi:hypothetical protein
LAARRFLSEAVVGNYPVYFAIGVEFHELGGMGAALVVVEENNAGDSLEDLDELKVETGDEGETFGEIVAESFKAVDVARRFVEHAGGGWGDEGNVRRVVREDAVEVMGVPGGDPVGGKMAGIGMRHGVFL